MKILQAGAPKCGNFWLYQIIQQILGRSGNHATSFIQKHPIYELAKDWELNYPSQASIDVLDITDLQSRYRISSIFSMPIDSFEEYVSQTNHVWTHSPFCKRSPEVFRHFDKKIYIIRDPRDRAISAANYYCSPYMLKYYPQEEKDPAAYLEKHFENLILEWVWHVYDHLRYQEKYNFHLIFYEQLLSDFQNTLSGLLDYLEVDLGPEERLQLEEAVSFRSLKKENPKHLKKGISGYWEEQLSASQKAQADILAGPLLRYLEYQEPNDLIPDTSREETFAKLKEDLIASQQLFTYHTPN